MSDTRDWGNVHFLCGTAPVDVNGGGGVINAVFCLFIVTRRLFLSIKVAPIVFHSPASSLSSTTTTTTR